MSSKSSTKKNVISNTICIIICSSFHNIEDEKYEYSKLMNNPLQSKIYNALGQMKPRALLPVHHTTFLDIWLNQLSKISFPSNKIYITTNALNNEAITEWSVKHTIPTKNIINTTESSKDQTMGVFKDIISTLNSQSDIFSQTFIIMGDEYCEPPIDLHQLFDIYIERPSNLLTHYNVKEKNEKKTGVFLAVDPANCMLSRIDVRISSKNIALQKTNELKVYRLETDVVDQNEQNINQNVNSNNNTQNLTEYYSQSMADKSQHVSEKTQNVSENSDLFSILGPVFIFDLKCINEMRRFVSELVGSQILMKQLNVSSSVSLAHFIKKYIMTFDFFSARVPFLFKLTDYNSSYLEDYVLLLKGIKNREKKIKLVEVNKSKKLMYNNDELLHFFNKNIKKKTNHTVAIPYECSLSSTNARVTLFGWPNANFYGRGISCTASNFFASVIILKNNDGIHFIPNEKYDRLNYEDIDEFSENVKNHQSLINVVKKVVYHFLMYCRVSGIILPTISGFDIRYDHNIPFAEGLAATVCTAVCVLKNLMIFYDISVLEFPLELQSVFIFDVVRNLVATDTTLFDTTALIYGGFISSLYPEIRLKTLGCAITRRLNYGESVIECSQTNAPSETEKSNFLNSKNSVVDSIKINFDNSYKLNFESSSDFNNLNQHNLSILTEKGDCSRSGVVSDEEKKMESIKNGSQPSPLLGKKQFYFFICYTENLSIEKKFQNFFLSLRVEMEKNLGEINQIFDELNFLSKKGEEFYTEGNYEEFKNVFLKTGKLQQQLFSPIIPSVVNDLLEIASNLNIPFTLCSSFDVFTIIIPEEVIENINARNENLNVKGENLETKNNKNNENIDPGILEQNFLDFIDVLYSSEWKCEQLLTDTNTLKNDTMPIDKRPHIFSKKYSLCQQSLNCEPVSIISSPESRLLLPTTSECSRCSPVRSTEMNPTKISIHSPYMESKSAHSLSFDLSKIPKIEFSINESGDGSTSPVSANSDKKIFTSNLSIINNKFGSSSSFESTKNEDFDEKISTKNNSSKIPVVNVPSTVSPSLPSNIPSQASKKYVRRSTVSVEFALPDIPTIPVYDYSKSSHFTSLKGSRTPGYNRSQNTLSQHNISRNLSMTSNPRHASTSLTKARTFSFNDKTHDRSLRTFDTIQETDIHHEVKDETSSQGSPKKE